MLMIRTRKTEVAQVERKGDWNIPLFKNGRFNIQLRLSKVSRIDSVNMSVVVYKPRRVLVIRVLKIIMIGMLVLG